MLDSSWKLSTGPKGQAYFYKENLGKKSINCSGLVKLSNPGSLYINRELPVPGDLDFKSGF
jgi:hypothetical protein